MHAQLTFAISISTDVLEAWRVLETDKLAILLGLHAERCNPVVVLADAVQAGSMRLDSKTRLGVFMAVVEICRQQRNVVDVVSNIRGATFNSNGNEAENIRISRTVEERKVRHLLRNRLEVINDLQTAVITMVLTVLRCVFLTLFAHRVMLAHILQAGREAGVVGENTFVDTSLHGDAGNMACVKLIRGLAIGANANFEISVAMDVEVQRKEAEIGINISRDDINQCDVKIGVIAFSLASDFRRFRGLVTDLVNPCINDILVQGARPLFFLDYVASSHLEPETVAEIVTGMTDACRASGCALLGGETAEMPGVYVEGELDVAGTIVGAVDSTKIIDGRGVKTGDIVIGLASDSPHTNGYSLIRKLVAGQNLSAHSEILGTTPIDALLTPHRSYLGDIDDLENAGIELKGLVHVTGGGLIENPPRILDEQLAIEIELSTWTVPKLYRWLADLGSVPLREMLRVFNMGLGMLVIVASEHVEAALGSLKTDAFVVGKVTQRSSASVEFVRQGEPVKIDVVEGIER